MNAISASGRGTTAKAPELTVLAVNSGSSSLKFGLYRVGPSETGMLLFGEVDSIGGSQGRFSARDSRQKELVCESVSAPDQ